MLGQTLSLASLGALGSLAVLWFGGRAGSGAQPDALPADSRLATPVVRDVAAAMAAGAPSRMLVLLHASELCRLSSAAEEAWPGLHARAADSGAAVGFAAADLGRDAALVAQLAPTRLPAYVSIECVAPGECAASDMAYGIGPGTAFVERMLDPSADWGAVHRHAVSRRQNLVGIMQMRLFYCTLKSLVVIADFVSDSAASHPILLSLGMGTFGILSVFGFS